MQCRHFELEINMKYKRWDDERNKFLIDNYSTMSKKELTDYLCISWGSVMAKACELKISRGLDYSEEDIEFIKNNFDKLSYKDIGKFLDRSETSVGGIASRLRLIKFTDWTEEEISLLVEKYPHYTNKYLSEKIFIGRASHSIRTKALKLGLHKTEEKGLKFFDKDEMILQLKNLAEKLNRTPSIDELSVYGLPSDTSYRRYFGGYRDACIIAGLQINESLWGKAKIYTSSCGDICYSNSELVITEFLIENKIPYEKEKKYDSICNDKRCKTKAMDWFILNEFVVEYWGYPKVESYRIGKDVKIRICKDNNIKLIEICRKDLSRLHTIFGQFL
jgi:hypothetical protein